MSNRNSRAPREGAVQEDPRVDGLLRAMEALGNIVGQQVRIREAAATTAAVAPPKDPGDPEASTCWIKELEKIFAPLRCTEEDKVTLAVYRLRGNANTWWEASRGRIFPEGTVLVWNAFVEAFNGKCFSDCAGEQKMNEFMRLRQNQMSVDRYEAKFAELSRYALRMVENPVDKARRFRDGLKPKLKDRLVFLNPKDYNEQYERAHRIERNMTERAIAFGSRYISSGRSDHRNGKMPISEEKHPIRPDRRNAIGKPALNVDGVCRLCGRRHGNAPCPFGGGVCFSCGQMGHLVKDGPQRQARVLAPLQQGGQPRRNTPQDNLDRPR
ncbi:uncharacterized protein LOC125312839 [Rhodamnia argentea]|uniref:Uncharacterized protein LOC125312839 n=1 Tax=Rhodamnia argentea TaxID=178133 RepID=A0ABM3GVM9_9MYRT|nr:uncharacterized protein LOC125312839 [Rhodamnia argentea]